MISNRYIALIKEIKHKYLPDNEVFIFGSSLKEKKFRDVDIAVSTSGDDKKDVYFKEALEDSTLPFLVDVVDLSTVDEKFKQEILKDKVLWL